ncbi:hypothetical protein ACLMJK_003184 [Lecanora helva]
MESQPPQRSILQQSSSSQAPVTNSSQTAPSRQHRRSSITQSTTSEDSQTVFLNHPSSSSESSPKPETQQINTTPRPKPHSAPSIKEPRKCWICFGDETEDTPTTSKWRSPCPCALTAHEECLLDWVADLEAPGKRKTSSKVECPQCKAKITIARPRSPVIEVIRTMEKVTGKLFLPSVGLAIFGTAFAGCWMHGLVTVYLIFGKDDARHILGVDTAARSGSPWLLTLSLIPVTLIASRTKMADNILPVIPIVYFTSNASRRNGPLWPPSAAFTVAALPYLRAIYNELYSRLVSPYEKTWVRAVQPRSGEDDDGERPQQDHNREGAQNEIPDGLNFELDLQVELVEEEEEEEEEAEEPQQQPQQPAENGPAGNQAQNAEGQPQDPAQNEPGNHPDPAQPQAPNQGGLQAGNLIIDVIATAQVAVGALAFPAVSAAMGSLLEVALPKTWTTPPTFWHRYPVGFLQSRLGRSIAGGCLFVALKDTLLLYAKYRLAQDHKKRRVVDYVPEKERSSSPSSS